MARPARRGKRGQAQAAAALVLDSEGLSKAAGDQRVVAWIARARELQLPLVLNAVTLTETIRGGGLDGDRTDNGDHGHSEPDLRSRLLSFLDMKCLPLMGDDATWTQPPPGGCQSDLRPCPRTQESRSPSS